MRLQASVLDDGCLLRTNGYAEISEEYSATLFLLKFK